MISNQTQLAGLKRRWVMVTAVAILTLLLFHLYLRQIWPHYANQWLFWAAAALIYVSLIVWRGLPENHRDGESELLPTLGLGNHLTLLRGLAMSLVAGFLFSPWPEGALAWGPMLLYTLADIADYFDGYLARITNHATLLGARLDIEFDGLGVLIVSVLGVWYGQLPWWYLLLGVSRFLFIGGLWLRERQGKPVYAMPESVHRRIIAGFQMGFMSAALWPIIPAEGSKIAGSVFGLATAVSFIRDWLVVSGQLNPAAPTYHHIRQKLYRIIVKQLPVALRLLVIVSMGVILADLPQLFAPNEWTQLLASWHLPWPRLLSGFISVAAVLATMAVGLGFIGRLAAFLLVFPIGFDMVLRGLLWSNGTALTAVCALMLLGSGLWSLWQSEEKYMTQRAGEQSA